MKTLYAGILIGIFICCGLYFLNNTFHSQALADYDMSQAPREITSPVVSRQSRLIDDVENHQKYEFKVAKQINLLQSRVLALETALKSHRITVPDTNTPFESILIPPMPGATRDIYGRRRHVPVKQEEPNN